MRHRGRSGHGLGGAWRGWEPRTVVRHHFIEVTARPPGVPHGFVVLGRADQPSKASSRLIIEYQATDIRCGGVGRVATILLQECVPLLVDGEGELAAGGDRGRHTQWC
jgi:hypothetical protein